MVYSKDFDSWHSEKKRLDSRGARIFFRERDIWYLGLGVNVGFEQDGKGQKFTRPVVIVKKFNDKLFWAIPLTTQLRQGKYYFCFTFNKSQKPSTAILSQIRLIDAKRLDNRIGMISQTDFANLKLKLKELLD